MTGIDALGVPKLDAIFLMAFHDKDLMNAIDTIESIRYHVKDNFHILCINDCDARLGESSELLQKYCDCLTNFRPRKDSTWPKNTYGSLFCKKYEGLEYAVKTFSFDYLVHLDADALVTGPDLLRHVRMYFAQGEPHLGLFGSYTTRSDGKKRTRWQWAAYLLYQVYITHEISAKSLLRTTWLPAARKNGYRLGEHVLGGAFILSRTCLAAMIKLYPYRQIIADRAYTIRLGDDVIFSLLTFACGFAIGDFARPGDPLAVAQDFLPIPKDEVLKRRKQLIHSLKRGLHGETEDELRTYFRSLRTNC